MIYTRPSLIYGMLRQAGSAAGLTANAANVWMACSFIAEESDITGVYLSLGTLTGTTGNIKITLSLRANNSSNRPDTTPIGSDVETTGGWVANKLSSCISVSWSGLTIGNVYWVIIKNTSAAPTVDYMQISPQMVGNVETLGGFPYGIGRIQTTDGGSSWVTAASLSTPIAIKHASGKLNVFPKDSTSPSDSSSVAYNGRLVGIQMVTPDNLTLRCSGATLQIRGIGTPPNSPYCQLWINGSLRATSIVRPLAATFVSSTSVDMLWPFDNIIIHPRSIVRVVVGMDGGDAANGVYYNGSISINDDAVLKQAKPCNGTMSKVYFNGSTWTVTDTRYGTGCLICDPVNPTVAPPLNRRKYSNQR